MQPLLPYWSQHEFPFTIEIGPLAIHSFGILVATGFWLGSRKSETMAARFGGNPALINRVVGWLIVGTFLGGHLGHIFAYEAKAVLSDPAMLFRPAETCGTKGLGPLLSCTPYILRVWQGLSSFGGFAACVPLAIYFFLKERKPFWPHGDGLAVGFTLGWFFGRMGCFTAHDHPGTASNFWLAVPGACEGGNPSVACHDLGLYEALFSGALFLVFEGFAKRARFPGFYCAILATTYGAFRLWLDFFRTSSVDVRYPDGGLTPAQYGSVGLIVIGLLIFANNAKKAPMWAVASTGAAEPSKA